MPGLTRTRSSLEADDDDSSSSSSDNANDNATPRPRDTNKRPRLSDQNGDVDDSWMLSLPGTVRPDRRRTPAAHTNTTGDPGSSTILSEGPSVSADKFKPGQLLKVHLRNFVTYTNATFQPGPSLNMIIGPNGTGKSTLVCAICIGLGFSTSHLGRAKELSEFVKHGTKDATIEITLKGMPGKINPEIRLDFARDGEKKQWHLNGNQVPAKAIKTITSRFGIQIDNLCHFLPQDRVVEFSRLSPKDRLTSTLRAAAAPEVIEQHEELKELAGERKKLRAEQTDKKTLLTQQKKRQDGQRGDVERMRERQEVMENVKRLEKLRPIAKHYEHRRAWDQGKAKRQTMEADLQRLNEQMQPFDEAYKKKHGYCTKVKKTLDLRNKLCEGLEKEVKKSSDEQEKVASDLKDVDQKRQTENAAQKQRQNQINTVRQQLGSVEAQMQQQPLDIDAAEYNRRIAAKIREVRDLEQQKTDIRDGGKERQQQLQEKHKQIQRTEQDLGNLSSQSGQQRHKLGRLSSDTLTAWEWIESHRDRLKGEVYGPALLTCSVKDQRYAPMIESLLGRMDFLRITCTNHEDYKFLAKFLAEDLRLSNYSIINLKSNPDDLRAPFGEQQVRDLGLDGWALDYLEGPEPVLRMLSGDRQLNATGVAWRDVGDDQFKALQNSGISSWVTSKSSYKITNRREYGPGASSTRVMSVPQQAQYWSSQGVDVSVEMELKQRLAELKDEIASLESTQGDTRARLEEVSRSIKTLEDEKEEIQNEKDEKQRHNANLAALPNKHNGLKNRLEEYLTIEAGRKQRLDEIRQQREVLILRSGQLAINYANLVDKLREKHAEVVPAAIAHIEAESDAVQLKQQHADATQERDRLVKEKAKLQDQMNLLKQKVKDTADEWRAHTLREPALEEYLNSLSEEEKSRTPQELELEVEALHARLETLWEGDPDMLRQFEDRGRKIERLGNELQNISAKTKQLQQKITGIRGAWEPAVDALADKISQAFSDLFARIGCAGSVQIHKPGAGGALNDDEEGNQEHADEPILEDGYDYENWAIQILVKFRENEQLSVLDSHRQSGGERAVTTIYYLMALQKLSRAPFRVVDEINQGMDPRNERIVHERMVDMSCGVDDEEEDDEEEDDEESKSQYFLITPKLLPGLKYERGMKVHCIASGEFMPKVDKRKPAMDFGEMLVRKRAMNRGRRVGRVVDG